MGPRLEAIAGPLEGATFVLSGEVSIGRDRCSTISIPDATLAGRQCAVRKQGEQFQLHVLEKSGTVLVNGLPVVCRVLQDGDEIKIGNSVFLVLFSDAASDAPLTMSELELPGGSIQILRRNSGPQRNGGSEDTLFAHSFSTRLEQSSARLPHRQLD